MITTITCNPAIDKTIYDDKEIYDVGGKGINVSKVLNSFSVTSTITGFLGKENKDIVLNDLKKYDLNFIEVDGKVRTNIKKIVNNILIENNEDGPKLNSEDLLKLIDYIKTIKDEIVVISGSIDKNVDDTFYEQLVRILKENNNYVILDCSKKQLENAINAKPNIIKPNKEEICSLFNIEYDENIVINKCKELIKTGIETIVVSLGEEGSLFINCDHVYKCEACTVDYKSSTGAGDAMVAGIAYSVLNKKEYIDLIRYAVACGSAATETEGTKAPGIDMINKFLNKIKIKTLE